MRSSLRQQKFTCIFPDASVRLHNVDGHFQCRWHSRLFWFSKWQVTVQVSSTSNRLSQTFRTKNSKYLVLHSLHRVGTFVPQGTQRYEHYTIFCRQNPIARKMLVAVFYSFLAILPANWKVLEFTFLSEFLAPLGTLVSDWFLIEKRKKIVISTREHEVRHKIMSSVWNIKARHGHVSMYFFWSWPSFICIFKI